MQLPLTGVPVAVIAGRVPPASDPPLNYRFMIELANVDIADFGVLASVMPGFSFQCPTAIPLDTSLKLIEVGYVINPVNGILVGLDLAVRSLSGLIAIPSIVAIKHFEFRFVCIASLPEQILASIFVPVQVHDDIELDLGATVALPPNFTSLSFEGSLSQDTPVPLRPFLAKFGADDAFFEGLQLAAFDFVVELESPASYAFSLETEGTSSIPLNGVPIGLETITVGISDPGSGNGSIETSFGGQIEIGDVPLYLGVTKSTDGWQFVGGTHGGQPIDFASWIDAVAQKFGYDDLPSSVKALTLSDILLIYDSGDQSNTFSFSCRGELAISDAVVDASIYIALSDNSGVATKSLSGELTVAAPSESLKFDLKVNVGPQGTTLIGTMATVAKPIGLLELLGTLGFHPDLPEGIDIKLDSLGVAYRTRTDETNKDASTFLLTANAQSYGRAMLVIDKTAVGTTYLFGANIPITGSLSDIPVVGNKLPPGLGCRSMGCNSCSLQSRSAKRRWRRSPHW